MNSTLIIAVGIVLLLTLITWALMSSGMKAARKKKEELQKRLDHLAQERDAMIGPSDFMGNKVIALDGKKGMIFYVDHTEDVIQAEVIDMADVSNCTVMKKGTKIIQSTKSGKVTTDEHVNRILLEVHMRTGAVVNLLFYDETKDGVFEMLSLKEKAEKWKAVINNAA